MAGENEIIFEDLHGVTDEGTVEVDLDKDDKDKHGIVRRPAQVDDDDPDAGGDDDDDDDDPDRGRDDLGDDDDDPDRGGDDDDDDPDRSSGDDDDGDGDLPVFDGIKSKKVRARLARATRAQNKERERAEYWEEQARLANEQLGKFKKESAKTVVERTNKEIESVEAQIEAAMEAGDSKLQVKLISQLTDLKAERIQAQHEMQNSDTDTGNRGADGGRVRTTTTGIPAKARNWKEKNADWYGANGFERQTRLANRIDREVFADGYDPNSDEYYRELNRRIKKKAPELFDDSSNSRRRRTDNRRRRSPVAGVDGAGDSRRSTQSGKVQLVGDDFANMRRFGLDTNDPEVLREYARNKRESESGARK